MSRSDERTRADGEARAGTGSPDPVEEDGAPERAGDDGGPGPIDEPDRGRVYERLDRVDDPELDRSIVGLEYITSVAIDGDHVEVAFVLPTAWCSPAFAWMMATGIRDEVGSLPAVGSVRVELSDHMHGEEVTHGVNEGLAFEEAFDEAEDGIEAVRAKLDEKTRLARQFHAFEALSDAGLTSDQIARLRLGDVDMAHAENTVAVTLRDGAVAVTVPEDPVADYVEKARTTGLVSGDDDRLFADRDGDTFEGEAFEAVRRQSRVAKANVTGQGAICSALHEARNGTVADD